MDYGHTVNDREQILYSLYQWRSLILLVFEPCLNIPGVSLLSHSCGVFSSQTENSLQFGNDIWRRLIVRFGNGDFWFELCGQFPPLKGLHKLISENVKFGTAILPYCHTAIPPYWLTTGPREPTMKGFIAQFADWHFSLFDNSTKVERRTSNGYLSTGIKFGDFAPIAPGLYTDLSMTRQYQRFEGIRCYIVCG